MAWKGQRRNPEWKKIFANDVTDKGLISRVNKQLTQLNIKKIKKQSYLKMGRRPEKTFFQRGNLDGQQAVKGCFTSLTIREMQIKTAIRYHPILVRMAIIKMNTSNRCW